MVCTHKHAHSYTHFAYTVTINGKQILHNISGRVGSGQLLGILGGSGAGKTTLLNAISGRILSSRPSSISQLFCCDQVKQKGTQVTGSVGYKQQRFELGESDEIKYISAYVMQNDIMCPTATGREALLFSSKLRSKQSKEKQLKIIDSVATSLKLTDCQNTHVGNDAIRGMSGGEKKRTSVGVELVVEPSLVFLDVRAVSMYLNTKLQAENNRNQPRDWTVSQHLRHWIFSNI